ncbi:MAG: MGMT family protein [Xanthomonadales bacterium]|nr:MGMT family protein [Xanthomonadales bacterium]MCC6562704.1 MGMT family protein [Xanthomonadales bacterium]
MGADVFETAHGRSPIRCAYATRVDTAAAIAAILASVRRIPAGRVSSYGEVAARAGLKGRARMVGRVLGMAPEDDPVPWYRVLKSDGRIAFPLGSDAFKEQSKCLRKEGVPVSKTGRVDLATHAWTAGQSLDELLWG